MLRSSYRAFLLSASVAALAGCASQSNLSSDHAGRPYPYGAAVLEVQQVQVFRDGTSIELVNHSPRSYENFELWLNERFLRRVDSLPVGGAVTLRLDEFVDEYGDSFRAGGLLATYRPDPVVKAEIETADGMIEWLVITQEP